jgi:NAD(P)-dependent dehydrogenase (short-subunit alcohol dehydrogenase family)
VVQAGGIGTMTDEEAIRRLLARFIQLRDDKQFDAWSGLFSDDAVFTYGSVRLEGRSAIRDHVASLLARDEGKHLCVNSVIDVDGDRASVSSDFAKLDPSTGGAGFVIGTAGRYLDELVRIEGSWCIARRDVIIQGRAPGARRRRLTVNGIALADRRTRPRARGERLQLTELCSLEGRTAIVTGGAGNIGSATVRALGALGAQVMVADNDGERASAVASEVDGAVSWLADVTHAGEVDAMVARAMALWGRVDIGVNVVGGGGVNGRTVLETSDDEWQWGIEHNLYSAIRCCRAYAQAMLSAGVAGSIVNVASPAALRAAPGMAAYGASKAALINFTWTLAVELGPHGIRCNVVVPAFVPNPRMSWGGSPDEQNALARRAVPMGRVTSAEDVAGAIVAFASGLMSFCTGQVVVCDGGRLLTNPINTGAPG